MLQEFVDGNPAAARQANRGCRCEIPMGPLALRLHQRYAAFRLRWANALRAKLLPFCRSRSASRLPPQVTVTTTKTAHYENSQKVAVSRNFSANTRARATAKTAPARSREHVEAPVKRGPLCYAAGTAPGLILASSSQRRHAARKAIDDDQWKSHAKTRAATRVANRPARTGAKAHRQTRRVG